MDSWQHGRAFFRINERSIRETLLGLPSQVAANRRIPIASCYKLFSNRVLCTRLQQQRQERCVQLTPENRNNAPEGSGYPFQGLEGPSQTLLLREIFFFTTDHSLVPRKESR